MMDLPAISLWGKEITLYALLAIAGWAFCAGLMIAFSPRFHIEKKSSALYALLASVMGLFLGRLIFCLVRMGTLFYDEMGDPLGLSPFFDVAAGSISVVGLMLGLFLAAPLCSHWTGSSSARLLDHAALPALGLFAFMRFIEPLSGEGYGIPLEETVFAFRPIALFNDWDEAMLNVCFIEGMLALIILIVLFFLRKKIRKPGTLVLYAALFFGVSQVLPEAFRWDDVLYIFVFARVTHIGLAAMLFFVMLLALLRGKKHIHPMAICLELLLTVICLGLCILAIYALDKITAWPPALVYSGWALVLVFLTILGCHRIHKEDIR